MKNEVEELKGDGGQVQGEARADDADVSQGPPGVELAAARVGDLEPDTEIQVTDDQRAAAHAMVSAKVDELNNLVTTKAAAAGITRVDANGIDQPVTAVFHVEPLVMEGAEPDKFTCPVCREEFKDSPGVKRHITRKHGGDATPTAATAAVASEQAPEDDGVRPVQRADVTVAAGDKGGFKFGGAQLFDMLAGVLPPPLTDEEQALLAMVKVEVTVPDWAGKWLILAYVFGPRLVSKFKVLKEKFDNDVAAEEAKLAAAKARARAVQRATMPEPPPPAPVAPAEPDPEQW